MRSVGQILQQRANFSARYGSEGLSFYLTTAEVPQGLNITAGIVS